MRGEYFILAFSRTRHIGSPPHAWRIPQAGGVAIYRLRITSTCVENTITLDHVRLKAWDHLHMRGEYFVLSLMMIRLIGSPPHAWRILRFESNDDQVNRITSTGVENTHT